MDAIRNVFSRLKSVWEATTKPSEEEMTRNDRNYSVAGGGRRSSQYPEQVHEESQDLEDFRVLVGIHQDRSFRPPHGFDPRKRPVVSANYRPAPNLGIYPIVFDNEVKAKRNYKQTSQLINGCLFLQIVVAAALTALGAANSNHHAVTVFGAINTVMAGILTYLKGSGLPNRLKYFQHEWGKVREYIEQRERDIIVKADHINVQDEVEKIRYMYEAVRADVEANTPDRFVGLTSMRHDPPRGNVLPRPLPEAQNKIVSETSSDGLRVSYVGAADSAQRMRANALDRVKEVGDAEKQMEAAGMDILRDRRADANAVAEKGTSFGTKLLGELHGLKDRWEEKKQEMSSLEKELEHDGQRAAQEKTVEAQDAARILAQRETERAAAAVAQQQEAALEAVAREREATREAAHSYLDQAFSSPGPKNDA